MVVVVAVVVAVVLGYFAYDYSRGQTEAMSITMAMQPDLDPEVAADLEGWAEAQDRGVLMKIVAGMCSFSPWSFSSPAFWSPTNSWDLRTS